MLLEYRIGVIGAESVSKALGSIEQRIVRHNANVNRIVGKTGSAANGGPSNNPIVQARKEQAALEREQRRQQVYWERANRKSLERRIREQEKSSRQEVKIAEKAAKAKATAAKREAIAVDREQRKQQAYWDRAQRQSAEHRIREQRRAARAEERTLRQNMATRRRFAEGTFGRIGSSVSGTLKATGALAGTALGLGGGFALAGAVQTQSREAAKASQLANQAGDPKLKGQLLKESRNVRGFTGEEALAGMEQFVTKTGDLGTARQIIGSLGQLSLATGANLEDLGATAGQAFNVLKDQIEDPTERVRQLNELMKTLAQQGAMGAVEIKDLARDFGKLGAATRAFEGDAPELLRTMGAFAQLAVARGGAESSADASTAASRLANDIVVNKKEIKALGVDFKSKKDPSKLRSPIEIMADILDKTGGDIEKTSGLFGLESAKIFKGLSAVYGEAERKEKGSGRGAVMKEFNRFMAADLSDSDVKARADSRLSDSDLQFKEALKDFNTRVGTELLPTLTKLIPEFSKLLPYVEQAVRVFAKLAEALAQDPVGGVGKLVAAKLALDLAMQGVSEAGRKLTGALSDATSRIPTAGGGGGGGALSAASTGASVGIGVATFIVTTGIFNFEKREADVKATGAALNQARELAAKGDVEGVVKLRQAEEGRLTSSKAPGVTESLIAGALEVAPMVSPLGAISKAYEWSTGNQLYDSDKAAQWVTGKTTDQNRDTALRSQESMVEEIRKLELSAAKMAAAAEKMGTGLNRGDAPSSNPAGK